MNKNNFAMFLLVRIILEATVLGFIVVILGLTSLTLVTGRPLSQAFADTQMMSVFFVTGALLILLSRLITLWTLPRHCPQSYADICDCGKDGCDCSK